MILTIIEPAGLAKVFLAGWFLVAGVFLLNNLKRDGEFLVDLSKVLLADVFFVFLVSFSNFLLVGLSNVFLAGFPDVFLAGWLFASFPILFLAVLLADLSNVLHVEVACVFHVELIWT